MNNRSLDNVATPSSGISSARAAATARALAALDVESHLADPSRKQAFVTPMFDVIAPRYDDFTRVFSFGMDARWKAAVVQAAVDALLKSGQRELRMLESGQRELRVLDLACGTGDLAVGVARALGGEHPERRVLGIDASHAMIQQASARLRGAAADVANHVHVSTGDMMALPAPDRSVDLITAGYGVRNAPDPVLAIREAARVLRAGGVYITLDFYRPEFWLWRQTLLRYLSLAGNLVGWAWHGERVVYGYISRSIDHFMSWQAFEHELNRNGFRTQSVRRWLAGGVAMHVAVRV